MDDQRRMYRNRAALDHLNGTQGVPLQEDGWINLREFGRREHIGSGSKPIEYTVFTGTHQRIGVLIDRMKQHPPTAPLTIETMQALNGIRNSEIVNREKDEELKKFYEKIIAHVRPGATIQMIATELTAVDGATTSCNSVKKGLQHMLRAYGGEIQRKQKIRRRTLEGLTRAEVTSR